MDATYMWKLPKLGRIGSSKLRFDDDFSDRLNYQFTGLLLCCFITLIGIRQYVGKPIQCWVPAEFSRSWEEYAENFCWVSSTYFSRLERPLHDEGIISYYQWAPIVLAIQALLFYIPTLIWRLFVGYSGYNLRRLLQMACDANNMIPEILSKNIRLMARYMESCIYRQRDHVRKGGAGTRVKHCITKCSCLCCGKRYGNFLLVLYFFVKMLYLVNIFGQLYLMEKFIGTSYTFYGVQVLYDLTQGREWSKSGHFPRVTFCDLEMKKLGKNQQYTVQCVLPMNMFLEKIYIFLWFWHVLVGCITLVSFLSWFLRMGFSVRRVKFIRKYLKVMNALRETDLTASRKFAEIYLRPDGIFIIRIIAINCGDMVAGDLVCELWNIFRHRRLQEAAVAEESNKLDDVKMPSFNYADKMNDDNSIV